MEKIIPDTVEGLRQFGIKQIITGHCTGWRAMHALADAFGGAVSQSAVGTKYTFAAGHTSSIPVWRMPASSRSNVLCAVVAFFADGQVIGRASRINSANSSGGGACREMHEVTTGKFPDNASDQLAGGSRARQGLEPRSILAGPLVCKD
jgi:hypothetical protein